MCGGDDPGQDGGGGPGGGPVVPRQLEQAQVHVGGRVEGTAGEEDHPLGGARSPGHPNSGMELFTQIPEIFTCSLIQSLLLEKVQV